MDDHSAAKFTADELKEIVDVAVEYQKMADIFVSHPALHTILDEMKNLGS